MTRTVINLLLAETILSTYLRLLGKTDLVFTLCNVLLSYILFLKTDSDHHIITGLNRYKSLSHNAFYKPNLKLNLIFKLICGLHGKKHIVFRQLLWQIILKYIPWMNCALRSHLGQWPYTFYAYPDVSLVVIMVWGHGRTWPEVAGKLGHRRCWCHCHQEGLFRALLANSIARSAGTRHSHWTSSSRWAWSPIPESRPHRCAARQGMTLKQPFTSALAHGTLESEETGKTSAQGCGKNVIASTPHVPIVYFTSHRAHPNRIRTWDTRTLTLCADSESLTTGKYLRVVRR